MFSHLVGDACTHSVRHLDEELTQSLKVSLCCYVSYFSPSFNSIKSRSFFFFLSFFSLTNLKFPKWIYEMKAKKRWKVKSVFCTYSLNAWDEECFHTNVHLLKTRGERCAYRFWYLQKGDLWLFSAISKHELSVQEKWQVCGGENDANIRDDFVRFFLNASLTRCH